MHKRRQRIGGQAVERVGAALTVLVASLCIPSVCWAHGWYSELRQPDNGELCCGGQDCHRIDDDGVRIGDGRLQIFIEGSWHEVDPDLILSTRSPDGDLHACWAYYRHFYYAQMKILCVILPPDS
jgi:hypothetical protein